MDLVRAYLSEDRVIAEFAARATGSKEKLSVSLPEEVAVGLERRHPGANLADVVRTLVLRQPVVASRPTSEGTSEARPITVTVPVAGGVEVSADGVPMARKVHTLLRRSASLTQPEPTLEIPIPPDLLEILDRVRGPATREALISQFVERVRMEEVTRELRRFDRIRSQIVDPRQFVPWIHQCLADDEWPEECIHAVGDPGAWLGEEIQSRLSGGAVELVVVARELELAPHGVDLVSVVHDAIVTALQRLGRAMQIRLAPVAFGDGQLWLVAQISPS